MVYHVDYCVSTQLTRHVPKSEPSWRPRPVDFSERWAEWAKLGALLVWENKYVFR